ncbi:hypothetical protein HY630_01810 [Candidatus Uhrbacteria bacterium]|nr:hypothetical protein [Candidatus Uhrbacteria bacterium]
MKRVWPLFVGLFVLSGCGQAAPSPEDSLGRLEPEAVLAQGNEYQNTRFGYALLVPDGMALYGLTPEQTAVAASEESDVVFLVEGETNFFTVRGIEDKRTPHEWLTENLSFFYPTGDAAQRIGELGGEPAIFLRGSGTSTSPARLIVLSREGTLLVISYEQETDTFESLVESFRTL